MDIVKETRESSPVERLLAAMAARASEYRLPFCAALVSGLLAHGFAFANKLLNADEVASLFSKGGGVDVGRWAIGLTSLLFPDISMPWIYGILSLLLFAVCACLTVRIFEIRSRSVQAVLAAGLLAFPALTALYCYMFTSTAYALALLLAVLSVLCGCREGWKWQALGCLLLTFSLGIYQAYVAVAASYYVLLMIQKLLRGEDAKAVFLFGVKAFLRLLISLAVYYLISRVALRISGAQYVNYGVERRSVFYTLALAYNAFFKAFSAGYFGFVSGKLSTVLHILLLAYLAVVFIGWLLHGRERLLSALLLLVCLILLPLSMNCVFLAADVEVIHTVVLYSFSSFYILAAIATEALDGKAALRGRDLLLVSLLVISLSNVYLANKTYLKQYIQYQNAQAFYTSVITQVKQTEGFGPDTKLAIMGQTKNAVYLPEELDVGYLAGPNDDLLNFYTRNSFIRTYVGFNVPFASAAEKRKLRKDERFQEMPEYPYYGSVQKIDGFIVVKLS